MSSKRQTSAVMEENKQALVPKLRFPEFREVKEWRELTGDALFDQVNDRKPEAGLPVLAITQEHGAIPRHLIDYHVSVSEKSIESYKVVRVGDFIISLRSFQGGIEYSQYYGICSPAYVILRRRNGDLAEYFRHYFKTESFIRILTKNLEGLRDGKMISYAQFSALLIPIPSRPEQKKIANCLDSLDELIAVQGRKVEALKTHKKGLIKQLFPQEGKTSNLRLYNFQEPWFESRLENLCMNISSGRDKLDPDGTFDLYGSTSIIGKTKKPSFHGERILIARVGANAGLLTKAKGAFGVTDNAIAINLNPSINLDFIYYYLESININKLIFGSGQPLITGSILKSLPIFVPSDLEQQRISSCLSSIDNLISIQNRKLEIIKTHKKSLMQQLFPSTAESAAQCLPLQI